MKPHSRRPYSRRESWHSLAIFVAIAVVLGAMAFLTGCTLPPPGTFEPIGRSTYGSLPDGRKVKLWTDNLTGTTTGTIGGESVGRLKAY